MVDAACLVVKDEVARHDERQPEHVLVVCAKPRSELAQPAAGNPEERQRGAREEGETTGRGRRGEMGKGANNVPETRCSCC